MLIAAFACLALTALTALALYGLVRWLAVGSLAGSADFSLETCLYFSAETHTSLGFGTSRRWVRSACWQALRRSTACC